MSISLYWHDYETFGVDPRRDRPAQFAGLHTDEAPNEVGESLVIYCKPARDVLPHPEACLLTNSVLVYDLRQDPIPFMDLDVEGLRDRLFTRAEDLPDGVDRLPVKSVKINKCAALAPRNSLHESIAERIAIDLDACVRHWELIDTNKDFMQRVARAYSGQEYSPAEDVDFALYDDKRAPPTLHLRDHDRQ